jgi:hypothetical protein
MTSKPPVNIWTRSYVQIIKTIKEQLNKLQQSGAIQGDDVRLWRKLLTPLFFSPRKRMPFRAI